MLAYTAAILHELAHMTASFKLGVCPCGITIGCFGARLDIEPCLLSCKKTAIYLAGPCFSLVLFLCLRLFKAVFYITNPMYEFFAAANLVIGIINLVPVFPLDGAIILRSYLSARLGAIRALRLCRCLAFVFVSGLLWLNILFISSGIFNPSLFVLALFLLMGINREKSYCVVERRLLLSADCKNKRKIKHIKCDGKSHMLSLAEYISFDYRLVILVFANERFVGALSQRDIIDGIKKYGALCTAEEYIRKQNICS